MFMNAAAVELMAWTVFAAQEFSTGELCWHVLIAAMLALLPLAHPLDGHVPRKRLSVCVASQVHIFLPCVCVCGCKVWVCGSVELRCFGASPYFRKSEFLSTIKKIMRLIL